MNRNAQSSQAENLTNFDFIDAPAAGRIASALEILSQLGAVDKDNGITELGRMMAEFPLDPHVCFISFVKRTNGDHFLQVSKALLESVKLKSSEQMLTIAAMLSGMCFFWTEAFSSD